MQEVGIVFHVIKKLENQSRNLNIGTVSKVTLEIGEMSGLQPDYLLDSWKWTVRKSQLLKNSELVIEQIEAVSVCNNCRGKFSPMEHGTKCPQCNSEDTTLITGNEMNIKEIEAC